MCTTFHIIPRRENPQRYDRNKKINSLIQKSFEDSISEFLEAPYPVYGGVIADDVFREWNSSKNKDIPYSSSTLGQSGCAVFTFHQGLRYSTKSVPTISTLAHVLASEEYYEPGKGTWHNLFDHWGLRRASDIKEVFDYFMLTIKERPIVTVLVSNKDYPYSESGVGSHFINLVGLTCKGFLIDDPNQEDRLFLEFKKILPAIHIAWIW